jgi:uncharacterized protein (TIGR02285 family)
MNKFVFSALLLFFLLPAVGCSRKTVITSTQPAISEKETIIWYVPDFPPAMIVSGPSKGQGFIDYLMQRIMLEADEYKYELLTANVARFVDAAKNGETAVHPYLLKNEEREKYLLFSLPAAVTVPHFVMFRKDREKDFSPFYKNGAIVLQDVFKAGVFNCAIPVDISYGEKIDSIIKNPEFAENVISRTGVNAGEGEVRMLDAGFADFIIAYPVNFNMVLRTVSFDNEFIMAPIYENRQNELMLAYIACTKNEAGTAFIKRVNSILMKKDIIEEVSSMREKYLDEVSAAEYRRLHNRMLKEYYQ